METNANQVLNSLRKHIENKNNGWGEVYLDNARPLGMNDKVFRANLAVLSKLGLYRPIDGYAFGDVKLED